MTYSGLAVIARTDVESRICQVMDRLYTERRMTGDEMRDAAQTLQVLVDNLVVINATTINDLRDMLEITTRNGASLFRLAAFLDVRRLEETLAQEGK